MEEQAFRAFGSPPCTDAVLDQHLTDASNDQMGGSPTAARHAKNQTTMKKQVLASCNLCRRRKIKCNRACPCSNCVRAGAPCVSNAASNIPRGRQGGRRKQDSELLHRIAILEHLVQDMEKETVRTPINVSAGAKRQQHVLEGAKGRIQPKAQEQTSLRSAAKSGNDGYMGTSLWVTLIDEINGLRDVLDDLSNNDDDDNDNDDNDDDDKDRKQSSQLRSPNSSISAHSNFFIHRPDFGSIGGNNPPPPTRTQVRTLCSIYLSNVDPIVKVLHSLSIWRYLNEETTELACSPGIRGLYALRYAVFYAATASLTPEDCERHIGEDRAALLSRYRAEVEYGLARADLVNTEEMSTLQALVILLHAVRADNSTRFAWTLTSLAVRIGHALGLHREGFVPSHPPFLREMRRRLWWQLCQLDSQAASDRGSDPIIPSSTFNTRLPLHIDDADIGPDDPLDPKERDTFTDMTFALICHEVFDTIRQLNYVPAGEPTKAVTEAEDPWARRRDWVIATQRRIEDRYLRLCNVAIPFQHYSRLIADIITAVMWLMAYRPLQRQPETSASIPMPYPGILHLSVEVIEKAHQISTNPVGKPFRWHSATWVMWHAMAVMLAQLCIQTEGPTVARAWSLVDCVFEEMALHVADSEKGRLWRPIRRLKNKASEVRKTRLTEPAATAHLSVTQPSSNRAPQMPGSNTALLNIDTGRQNQKAGDDTMETIQVGGQDSLITQPVSIDWDPWLNMNMSGLTHYSDEIDQMVLANWDNFLSDFQGEGGVDLETDMMMIM